MTQRPADSDAALPPGSWIDAQVDPAAYGGAAFAALLAAVRELHDQFAGAAMPEALMDELVRDVRALTTTMARWEAPETDRPTGRRFDLPGRGHPLLVPMVVDEETATTVRGRVELGTRHLGGNGAAHGGVQPLLFDDVLGILLSRGGRPRMRTASLTVNYRRIAPIGRELQVEATVDGSEGRKWWASGRLLDGDVLLADASGLFVELRAGQP